MFRWSVGYLYQESIVVMEKDNIKDANYDEFKEVKVALSEGFMRGLVNEMNAVSKAKKESNRNSYGL